MEQWNSDLALAPNDGTPFLAAIEIHRVNSDEKWWEMHVISVDPEEPGEIDRDFEQGWSLADYTHWMPLPPPPLSA